MQTPRYFCPIFTKTRKIFIKVANIKFHGNPSCGHRADACGADGQRWTDMKDIGASCDYANVLQQSWAATQTTAFLNVVLGDITSKS